MIISRVVDINSQAVSPLFIVRSFLPTGVVALVARGCPMGIGLVRKAREPPGRGRPRGRTEKVSVRGRAARSGLGRLRRGSETPDPGGSGGVEQVPVGAGRAYETVADDGDRVVSVVVGDPGQTVAAQQERGRGVGV